MADSGSIVPGLSNKYNSQATIEKIMNKKREKVDKMNDEKKKIDETRQSIGEVSQKVLSLDKSAKRLYGTGSSFENKIGESSSSKIATKIEKTADRGEYSINVIEKASSHKIASIPLNKSLLLSFEKTISLFSPTAFDSKTKTLVLDVLEIIEDLTTSLA